VESYITFVKYPKEAKEFATEYIKRNVLCSQNGLSMGVIYPVIAIQDGKVFTTIFIGGHMKGQLN